MAKKTLNPADAHRKALRKKELKKNKAERSKARDFALVKKDTGDIEDEIARLSADHDINPQEKARLAELKAELEKINRKKAEYVEEHPEQRRLVYRPRRKEGDQEEREELVLKKRNKFDKNGLPRHPERSVYYDPVMNPYGVAPPGMPYMERALLPGEIDSEEEEEDNEDDIPMPPGLPPGSEYIEMDDEISMPDESLPSQTSSAPMPPLPQMQFNVQMGQHPVFPPPVFNFPQGAAIPPPPPSGFSASQTIPPPPPPAFTGGPPLFHPSLLPPTNFHPAGFPGHGLPPPPPPGFFPRSQSSGSVQDPLSSVPHQTFQAHRISLQAPPHPSLPENPIRGLPATISLPARPTAAAELAAATVFAAPELRDFKKEVIAFVPSALTRKRATGASTGSKIDAAPLLSTEKDDNDGSQEAAGPVRPDLVSALKDKFGQAPGGHMDGGDGSSRCKKVKAGGRKQDDYEKFMAEMGDILGSRS